MGLVSNISCSMWSLLSSENNSPSNLENIMHTVELNEQQVEFIKENFMWQLENENMSATSQNIMSKIINKLNTE